MKEFNPVQKIETNENFIASDNQIKLKNGKFIKLTDFEENSIDFYPECMVVKIQTPFDIGFIDVYNNQGKNIIQLRHFKNTAHNIIPCEEGVYVESSDKRGKRYGFYDYGGRFFAVEYEKGDLVMNVNNFYNEREM